MSECQQCRYIYVELSSRIQTYWHWIDNADSTTQKKNIIAALSSGKSVIRMRFSRATQTEHGLLLMRFIIMYILFCHLSLFNIHLKTMIASTEHYAPKRHASHFLRCASCAVFHLKSYLAYSAAPRTLASRRISVRGRACLSPHLTLVVPSRVVSGLRGFYARTAA